MPDFGKDDKVVDTFGEQDVAVVEPSKTNIYSTVPPEEIEKFAKQVLALSRQFETPPDPIEQYYMKYEEDLSAASQRSWKELEDLQKTYPISGVGIARESAKGVVRFAEEGVGGQLGGAWYEWIGDFVQFGGRQIELYAQQFSKNPDMLYNPYAQSIIATGENISRTGRAARKEWEIRAATGWEKLDKDLKKTDPISYGAGRISEGVGSSAMAVLSIYLSGGSTTPVLASKGVQINKGLAILATLSASSSYIHAKSQYPEKENFLQTTAHGLTDGIIEYIMESTFLAGIGGSMAWAGPKEGLEELVTGMLQNTRAGILENTAKGMSTYDASKKAVVDALKQSPWEVAAGIVGGYGVYGGTSFAQMAQSSAAAVKRIAKPKGAIPEAYQSVMNELNAELAEIEQTLGVGPQAQQRRLEVRNQAEMKMVALDMQKAMEDLERIDAEKAPEPPVQPSKPKITPTAPVVVKPTEQKALWSETTPTEDTTSGAAKAEAVFNKADIELQRIKDSQKGIGKLWRKVKRAVVDTSASIKKSLLKEGGKYGKEAVIRHDLIKGATSKSAKITNKANEKVYKGLKKDEIKTLDRIIQARRVIAIDKYKPAAPGQDPLFATTKHPGGLTAEENTAYIKNLPEKTRAKLNAKADLYFKEMQNQLDALRDAGLISETLYNSLVEAGDYEPRRFIQHIDPERTGYTAAGKTISVPDSGLKKLDAGSYESLENNSQLLLSEVVHRTQTRIARNNANQALWQMVKDVPDNGIVQEAEIENVSNLTTRAEYTYKPAPAGFEKISVVVDGITRQMLMPTEIAKEWVGSDPVLNAQVGWWIGLLSGSKILKPMATGLNPEFALSNFPRDIAHVLLTTEEYSPHLAIALSQITQDLRTVQKDAFTRKGRWLDFIDEGGFMEFLTHQGGVTSKATGALKDLETSFGYAGETSEVWVRLALRERALRNGKSNIEATWIARNYLDFSQGGNVAKAIDTAVPYFNASIQGTRGIFRAAAQNPKIFAYKAAQLGILATGLMLANRYRNKEAWDSISSHDKANYFIFTTPFSYTDKEGEKRYLYFRVAKDQGQKMITSVFENLMAKYLGDEVDVDQVTDAARGIGIVAPSDMLPPTFDAILGYAMNKDFWRNEDIWKRKDVIDREEYTNYTHPAYIKVGEITGLSPEKTRYALSQLFTSGNIYTTMVDWGLGQIMDGMPEKDQEKVTEDILRQQPFIRRILKTTDPFNEHEKVVERIKLEEDTRIYKQNRELDALITRNYAGKVSDDEVDNFIYTKDITDAGRLEERRMRSLEFKGIPDRRWWLELSYAGPEAAANMYWARYNNADKAEKKKLDNYLVELPGIASERFMKRLNELENK